MNSKRLQGYKRLALGWMRKDDGSSATYANAIGEEILGLTVLDLLARLEIAEAALQNAVEIFKSEGDMVTADAFIADVEKINSEEPLS